MRGALKASLKIVPDTLAETIATQRVQIDDQTRFVAESWKDQDWELLEAAARNLHAVTKAYRENLEMQSMSRCLVIEASTQALIDEAVKRAKKGETDVEKTLTDALKRIRQPKRKGVARGGV